MTSVWKRLQRVGKKASKFQFVASYQEIVLECTKKWQPDKLRVVWTRRNRRMCSKLHSWQPGIKNPYRGMVVWPVPENIDISVTLFKELNADEFEDKEWTFVIEGENKGHRKVLASADINLKHFASPTPTQTDLTLKLKPLSVKVVEATLKLSLSCVFVREGKATDEDMQSLASLMSVKPADIGNLDDFNESDEDEDKKSITAAAPHVLVRPNRPAPPPPDKRTSTGYSLPACGKEGGRPASGPLGPALQSRPPLPITPRPSPRRSRHALSTTPVQPGAPPSPSPSPQPSPRSKHNKSATSVQPEAPPPFDSLPTPSAHSNPPSPKSSKTRAPVLAPSTQAPSSVLSLSAMSSSPPNPPAPKCSDTALALPAPSPQSSSAVPPFPQPFSLPKPPSTETHRAPVPSDAPSTLPPEPPKVPRADINSSPPKPQLQPTITKPSASSSAPQHPSCSASTTPTLHLIPSTTSSKPLYSSSPFPPKYIQSVQPPSTYPPITRTVSQPPSLPRIFQPSMGKVSYQRRLPEVHAGCADEPSFSPVHSHIFRPQIVKTIDRPSSPSPFSPDALPLDKTEQTMATTPPLPKPHPSGSESVGQGAWVRSKAPLYDPSLIGGDISPVPLLTSPDLDALCDPEAPPLSASLPRSPPSRSSALSSSPLSIAPSQLPASALALPAELIPCQPGSKFPPAHVDKQTTPVSKETTPRGEESPRGIRTVASIRIANQPSRPAQNSKQTIAEGQAEPGRISPGHTPSELIIAPPPPWPFSCPENPASQQPSTNVVAAFITTKQPLAQEEMDFKKLTNESERMVNPFLAEKPPLAEPELDFDDIIFESTKQCQESGGLFLEDDDSKGDTIKRSPLRLPASHLPPPEETVVTPKRPPWAQEVISQSQDRNANIQQSQERKAVVSLADDEPRPVSTGMKTNERSHGEDAAEAETGNSQEQQPITAQGSEKHHIVPPLCEPCLPTVEEEPESPAIESATSMKVFPKPASGPMALGLEPQLPTKPELESASESGLQPPGEPQLEQADQEQPPNTMAGDLERTTNEEPVIEAEKPLWAAVEETTVEKAVDGGIESHQISGEKEEEEKREEKSGVAGGYEIMTSILYSTGPDAGQPCPSTDQPCPFMVDEGQQCPTKADLDFPCPSDVDAGQLCPSGVDILLPAAFSDTTEERTISKKNLSRATLSLAPEPEMLPYETHGLSLVASLRLAASQHEREREERERKEREKTEMEKEEREQRESVEREEIERKQEKERAEREKEEGERVERLRAETEKREREEREKREKEKKEKAEKERDQRERVKREERERKEREEVEKKRENSLEVAKESQKHQECKKNKSEKRQETLPGFPSVQNTQELAYSQSNDWPPLREAELEEIAYHEEQLEGDSEGSEHKSDPKLVKRLHPNAEAKTVLNEPGPTALEESFAGARPKVDKADARSSNIEDCKPAVIDALDEPGPRSVKRENSNLKTGAIPVWMREDEEEGIEYERGQEDLGTVWLAELYMDGEGGPDPSCKTPATTQEPSYLSLFSNHYPQSQGSAVNQPNKSEGSGSPTNQVAPPHHGNRKSLPHPVPKQEVGISQTTNDKPAPLHGDVHKQTKTGQRDGMETDGVVVKMANQGGDELVQSSVVPWPLPPITTTTKIQTDSQTSKIHIDSHSDMHAPKGIAMQADIHTDTNNSKSPSKDMDTHATKSASIHTTDTHSDTHTSNTTGDVHTETRISEPNLLTRDEQLQEEEKFLLAKLRQLICDTSPALTPRGKKRLIPDLRDINSDILEPNSQSESSTEAGTAADWKTADKSQHSIVSYFLAQEESVSLAQAGETKVVQEEEGLKQDVKEWP